MTGYRATSQRWWYLPYTVVDQTGLEPGSRFLTLIPSQKPVLRKFQRFSTSERYRMLG